MRGELQTTHGTRERYAILAADVGAALARHPTLAVALNGCCVAIVQNLDAAFARVWTYNEGTSTLELEASAGMYTHLDGPHARVPLGAFKIGRIAATRAPHLTNDVQHDPQVGDRAWATRESLISFAGYPLIVEDRLVGVIALFARAPLPDVCLDALAGIADLVAVGIERKRGEARLRRSEARHRLVSEAANEGIWFWDLATGTVECNERLLDLLGIDRAAWPGTIDDLRARVHPDDRGAFDASLAEHLESRARLELELRFRCAGSIYRVCATRGLAEWDATGKPNCVAGAVTDVHDRRLAERALAASEHRFAQILDSVRDLIFCKDRRLVVTYANKAACDYYGMTVEELRGMSDVPFNERDLAAQHLRDDLAVLEKGEPVENPAEPNRSRDGETRLFYTVKTPIRDEAGEIVELVGVARDVTERRRVEVMEVFLVKASALLSASIEYAETLRNVAGMAVPEVADWCAVDLLVDGEIRRLAVAHVDPAKVQIAHELQRRWPSKLEDPGGVGEVLRTGKTQLVAWVDDDVLAATLPDPEMLPMVRSLGLHSWIVVPLNAHGRTLGAITFVSAESQRRYGAAELGLAEGLASRAAVAIENARLYEETRSAVRARDQALAEVQRLNEKLEQRVVERTAQLTEANGELTASLQV